MRGRGQGRRGGEGSFGEERRPYEGWREMETGVVETFGFALWWPLSPSFFAPLAAAHRRLAPRVFALRRRPPWREKHSPSKREAGKEGGAGGEGEIKSEGRT